MNKKTITYHNNPMSDAFLMKYMTTIQFYRFRTKFIFVQTNGTLESLI